MRAACLINHYNYAQFLEEAVAGVLGQSTPLDEIVVVDDGSDERSREVAARLGGRDPRIRVMLKSNEGQLSCFNAGFAGSTADVVFFLDADDIWEPGYVEAALAVYRARPDVDFIACHHLRVEQGGPAVSKVLADRDLGYSVLRALALRRWVGAPTSCLSMRRGLLSRILPLPLEEDWRTRADDCLVYGASLAGGRKFFLGRPLVRYRIHGGNQFQGRALDRDVDYRRRLAVSRLTAHMVARMGYGPGLDDHAHREFQTIERPTAREFHDYRRIAWRSGSPWHRKLSMVVSMCGYYGLGSKRA
jgi:glycosyltransferase involved in cell wall biosynthesis